MLKIDSKYDATGRSKQDQKVLLLFTILLTIVGFILNIIVTGTIFRYVRAAARCVRSMQGIQCRMFIALI